MKQLEENVKIKRFLDEMICQDNRMTAFPIVHQVQVKKTRVEIGDDGEEFENEYWETDRVFLTNYEADRYAHSIHLKARIYVSSMQDDRLFRDFMDEIIRLYTGHRTLEDAHYSYVNFLKSGVISIKAEKKG